MKMYNKDSLREAVLKLPDKPSNIIRPVDGVRCTVFDDRDHSEFHAVITSSNTISLYFSQKGGITVWDWGDGSTSSQTSTGNTFKEYTTGHTYQARGEYTIKVYAREGGIWVPGWDTKSFEGVSSSSKMVSGFITEAYMGDGCILNATSNGFRLGNEEIIHLSKDTKAFSNSSIPVSANELSLPKGLEQCGSVGTAASRTHVNLFIEDWDAFCKTTGVLFSSNLVNINEGVVFAGDTLMTDLVLNEDANIEAGRFRCFGKFKRIVVEKGIRSLPTNLFAYIEADTIDIGEDVTDIGQSAISTGVGRMIKIICRATTPPLVNDSYIAFDLYVPEGSITAYQEDPVWGRANNIYPIT